MKTCSAWLLIVVLHFRSLERRGSSINYISYISADNYHITEAEILSHKHGHSLLLFDRSP